MKIRIEEEETGE